MGWASASWAGEVGAGELVEVLVLVVGSAAGQQSGVAPCLDGAGADSEVVGDVCEGEQSFIAQPLGVAA